MICLPWSRQNEKQNHEHKEKQKNGIEEYTPQNKNIRC